MTIYILLAWQSFLLLFMLFRDLRKVRVRIRHLLPAAHPFMQTAQLIVLILGRHPILTRRLGFIFLVNFLNHYISDWPVNCLVIFWGLRHLELLV